jgi:hypothetical protein
MQNIQSPAGPEKARACLSHTPTQADRLDELAHRVARLGRGCRDPEAFVVAKLTVAAELRQLAREVRA